MGLDLGKVVSGAATGASVGGPWGAVIGGGISLLSSIFDGDKKEGTNNTATTAQNDNSKGILGGLLDSII